MKGLLLKVSGETQVVDLKAPLYKALNPLVAGYIEIVRPAGIRLPEQFVMVVNEEGHCIELPINPKASKIYGFSPWIAGDVVFVREGCAKGEIDFIESTDEQIEVIRQLLEVL